MKKLLFILGILTITATSFASETSQKCIQRGTSLISKMLELNQVVTPDFKPKISLLRVSRDEESLKTIWDAEYADKLGDYQSFTLTSFSDSDDCSFTGVSQCNAYDSTGPCLSWKLNNKLRSEFLDVVYNNIPAKMVIEELNQKYDLKIDYSQINNLGITLNLQNTPLYYLLLYVTELSGNHMELSHGKVLLYPQTPNQK